MNRLKDVPKFASIRLLTGAVVASIAQHAMNIEGTNPSAVGSYLFDKHRIFYGPDHSRNSGAFRTTPNVYTTLGEAGSLLERDGGSMPAKDCLERRCFSH